ncbi:MAG: methyltransferase domain-containing protein [Alphaproteobacteria bacterium]|nr:methyltransferase domain-containing protein [Alphaproteobacteria bacterium]
MERDYILGTHDAEIERLELQHRVWRPYMLNAWRRADITLGQTVIDLGSGPGYATLDLAEIVGDGGRVIAIERSKRFVDALRGAATRNARANVTVVEADVTEGSFGEAVADALWCRWVFAWLTEPSRAVDNIARAVKPGGIVVLHEYLNYGSWGLLPSDPAFDTLVRAIIENVAKSGADIDSGRYLPRMLEAARFDIVALNPIVDVVSPTNFVWHWPAAFARSYHRKLIDDGLLSNQDAAAAIAALDRAESGLEARMATPTLLEIIARRR